MSVRTFLIVLAVVGFSAQSAYGQSWNQYKQAGMWKEAWLLMQKNGREDPRYFETLKGLAAQFVSQGDLKEAQNLYEIAASAPSTQVNSDSMVAACLRDYLKIIDPEKRPADYERIKGLCPAETAMNQRQEEPVTISAPKQSEEWLLYLTKGKAALNNSQLSEAETQFRKSLIEAEADSCKNKNAHQVEVLNELISLYYKTNNLQAAEGCWQKVLPLLEKIYGNNDLQMANAFNAHGKLLRKLNRRQAAMDEEYKADLIVAKNDEAVSAANSISSSGFAWGGGGAATGKSPLKVTSGVGGAAGFAKAAVSPAQAPVAAPAPAPVAAPPPVTVPSPASGSG